MNKRPNILFINTDQHSWDALSTHGNPYLRTPNIDALHRNGTSFRQSYCTDPVCAAARSSWATGLIYLRNGCPFPTVDIYTQKFPILVKCSARVAIKRSIVVSGMFRVGMSVESFQTLYYGRRNIGAGGAAYYDSASTHAVADFLTNYDGDDPFYLQIGYVDPHDVCEYLHNHEEKRIPNPVEQGIVSEDVLPPLPENFDYDERETVLHRVCRRVDDALIHAAILKGVRDWDELQWRYLRWNYYRFIEKVDAEIGRVLALLRETSLHHSTIIIFSADHGEACGSHQMFQKFTLYEESVRVPFIVACLGDEISIEKDRFDDTHFVSGVDVFPTVCDYAGVDVPEGLQGTSVRPLADGRDVPWRDCAYIESNYWGRAVVTEQYKYVTEYRPKAVEDFLPPGPDAAQFGLAQLFDRHDDPGETRNLIEDAAYSEVVETCQDKLLAQEARLHRQEMVHPNPKRIISNWGDRLRSYWQDNR